MGKRIEDHDYANNITDDDVILIVNDPSGVPETLIITKQNFFANVSTIRANTFTVKATKTPPANSNVTGQTAGELYIGTDGYLYFASNTSHTRRMGPFETF